MNHARTSIQNALDALTRLASDELAINRIHEAASLIARSIRAGGKVLACGNGGSACDAMHFCEELTGRFRDDRPPLPAIACNDPGHITCTANDYGYDAVFERWVRALARPGDALILLTTSGKSPNILRAAHAARELRCTTIALLGKDGGKLRGACDIEWIVPGETSDRIQELHMLLLHSLVEAIEAERPWQTT